MTGQVDDEPDLVDARGCGPATATCSAPTASPTSSRRDIIEEILSESPNPSATADRLIEVALRASARDNVTVVIADVVDLRDAEAPSTSPQIVGAASLRDREGKRTRAIPITPAAEGRQPGPLGARAVRG